MSTLYECTAIIKKKKFNKIKDVFEENGNRIKFGKPYDIDEDTYMVCFDSNGSLYDDSAKWFTKSLKNIVAYEEDCIEEQEPFFSSYINGDWNESETSILRQHYDIPKYFNEKL